MDHGHVGVVSISMPCAPMVGSCSRGRQTTRTPLDAWDRCRSVALSRSTTTCTCTELRDPCRGGVTRRANYYPLIFLLTSTQVSSTRLHRTSVVAYQPVDVLRRSPDVVLLLAIVLRLSCCCTRHKDIQQLQSSCLALSLRCRMRAAPAVERTVTERATGQRRGRAPGADAPSAVSSETMCIACRPASRKPHRGRAFIGRMRSHRRSRARSTGRTTGAGVGRRQYLVGEAQLADALRGGDVAPELGGLPVHRPAGGHARGRL